MVDDERLQEQREEVVTAAVAAEPRHGQLWQAVSKDSKNWRAKTEDILKAVASKIQVPR